MVCVNKWLSVECRFQDRYINAIIIVIINNNYMKSHIRAHSAYPMTVQKSHHLLFIVSLIESYFSLPTSITVPIWNVHCRPNDTPSHSELTDSLFGSLCVSCNRKRPVTEGRLSK